jgi:hypothetical protein
MKSNTITKEMIVTEIEGMYNDAMSSANKIYEESENGGGKVRQSNGDLVERMFKRIAYLVCNMNGFNSVKITGKKEDSIRITSKSGGYIDASVDVHAIVPETVSFFAECKTYLDKCYLDRASSDLKHFKKPGTKNVCFIISLENAVSKSSEAYFLDEGYIDNIFYLVDGKRSSAKPIWKKDHFKPLNKSKVMELINCVEKHLKANKKD